MISKVQSLKGDCRVAWVTRAVEYIVCLLHLVGKGRPVPVQNLGNIDPRVP